MQFFLLKERFFCKNYNFSAKTILFLANYLLISKKSSTFAVQTQIYRVSAKRIYYVSATSSDEPVKFSSEAAQKKRGQEIFSLI